MSTNRQYPFMPLGNVSVNAVEKLTVSGIYDINEPSKTIGGWTAYGNIIVLNSGEKFISQVFIHGQGLMKFRVTISQSSEWTDWIILT